MNYICSRWSSGKTGNCDAMPVMIVTVSVELSGGEPLSDTTIFTWRKKRQHLALFFNTSVANLSILSLSKKDYTTNLTTLIVQIDVLSLKRKNELYQPETGYDWIQCFLINSMDKSYGYICIGELLFKYVRHNMHITICTQNTCAHVLIYEVLCIMQ